MITIDRAEASSKASKARDMDLAAHPAHLEPRYHVARGVQAQHDESAGLGKPDQVLSADEEPFFQ